MKHIKYYGAKSNLPLEEVCNNLKENLKLNEFRFGSHDTWEYAYSSNENFSINITKTEYYDTIQGWMKTAPNDINYQIVLTLFSTHSDGDCQSIYQMVFDVFGESFSLYESESESE